MSEQQWLKSLDREASAPHVDVTTSVLRDIRLRNASASDSGLTWPALIATLAGSAAAFVALQMVGTMQDPFSGLLDAFKLVLQ